VSPVEVSQVPGPLARCESHGVAHTGQHLVHEQPCRRHGVSRLIHEHALDLVDALLPVLQLVGRQGVWFEAGAPAAATDHQPDHDEHDDHDCHDHHDQDGLTLHRDPQVSSVLAITIDVARLTGQMRSGQLLQSSA
jgi:hypothetical protein